MTASMIVTRNDGSKEEDKPLLLTQVEKKMILGWFDQLKGFFRNPGGVGSTDYGRAQFDLARKIATDIGEPDRYPAAELSEVAEAAGESA